MAMTRSQAVRVRAVLIQALIQLEHDGNGSPYLLTGDEELCRVHQMYRNNTRFRVSCQNSALQIMEKVNQALGPLPPNQW